MKERTFLSDFTNTFLQTTRVCDGVVTLRWLTDRTCFGRARNQVKCVCHRDVYHSHHWWNRRDEETEW